MKIQYLNLIDQTFEWPQEEFGFDDQGSLTFHKIELMKLIKEHGTPLKFTYLPKIGQNIHSARKWFDDAMKRLDYNAEYHYCYVTKSSHFNFVLEAAVKAGAHIETSSPFDLDIVMSLYKQGKIDTSKRIICNGFKKEEYIRNINSLVKAGFT